MLLGWFHVSHRLFSLVGKSVDYTFNITVSGHVCPRCRKLKEERRKQQEENVNKKKQLKEEMKKKSVDGMKKKVQFKEEEQEHAKDDKKSEDKESDGAASEGWLHVTFSGKMRIKKHVSVCLLLNFFDEVARSVSGSQDPFI